MTQKLFYLFALLVFSTITNAQATLSPFDYGWKEAATDVERFRVLYNVQSEGVRLGKDVDYSGIDTANIELGYGCAPIPLTDTNDFCGMVINVRNTARNDYLFSRIEKPTAITLSKASIDAGDFTDVPELCNGEYMLIIKDKNTWGERIGYSDKVIRKDVLHTKNGKALNNVIMPYNNVQSDPECEYIAVRRKPLVIKGMTINRSGSDNFSTYIIRLHCLDNISLNNITINTPQKNSYGDMAIRIYDSMNVTFNNININGTYSKTDKWGYGFNLNNIHNLIAKRLNGHAAWGIFGNNNINTALLEDCDINRWDIHSYGKDITINRCTFTGMYNQHSSVYGEVTYDSCTFINHVPMLIEWSYGALVPTTVRLMDCTIKGDVSTCTLGRIKLDRTHRSPRKELEKWTIPTLILQNTKLEDTTGTKSSTTIIYKKITDVQTINATLNKFF